MLKVVRTRKVRAIEERFYGRTARIFHVGEIDPEQAAELTNLLGVAAADSRAAHLNDRLRAILRRARIPREHGAEFWDRVFSSPTNSDRSRAPATPYTPSSPGSTRPTTRRWLIKTMRKDRSPSPTVEVLDPGEDASVPKPIADLIQIYRRLRAADPTESRSPSSSHCQPRSAIVVSRLFASSAMPFELRVPEI
jgi:hypothetical protein